MKKEKPEIPQLLLSVLEASIMLNISKSTVRRRCLSGKLPYVQVERRMQIPREVVEEYIKRHLRGRVE